jgi:hypothetical protein
MGLEEMGLEERVNIRRLAKMASRGLFAPGSLSPDEIRAVCAAALKHVPDHRQAAMVEARPHYEQVDMALAIARCSDPAEQP